MQNIDVRFNATSNFSKVRSDLAALETQAAALNDTFRKGAYAKPPMLVDPAAWGQATAAVTAASRVYRNAASSSGLWTTQQIRATSEAEKFTKALQKQKLSFSDMRKNSNIMKEVYNDQLRMQRMTAQYWGTDSKGRAITDIAIPKNVPRDLSTIGQKLSMVGAMAQSAGTQFTNMGKNMQWAGRQLTVGLSYPIALFGAAAGVMTYKAEASMAKINKVYDFSTKAQENEAQMVKETAHLRAASFDMASKSAAQYGSTLESTLSVEKELAATGLKGSQLLSTTQNVQRISTLGDIDPEQTTKMVVALQNTMLKGDKSAATLTNTLNYLNAASNATSLDLQDIATSVPRAASAFNSLGGDTKQLTMMLVAMRESGVEAAQGANAIKSASARVLNPVKKAVDLYAQYGINIDKISKESGGNLFNFLQKLGVEQQKINGKTAKQTAYLRAQGIATLFGTYQYNRLNAALVNVTDAYGGVQNQTSKVMELNQKSSAQLAEMAENSRKAMMNNPAGRFRQEWAQFQIQLAQMGQPFLEVANDALSAATNVGKFFNSLDDATKKKAAYAAIALAIVGPLIMLGGLFTNLTGQFATGVGKVMSAVGRLAGGMGIVTKEQKAASLTTEAQNKVLGQQESQTAMLAHEVDVLAEAMRQATIASKQYFSSMSGGMNASGLPQGTIYNAPTQNIKTQAGRYQLTSQEQTYYSARSKMPDPTQEERLARARNTMAKDYMQSMNVVSRDATDIQKKTAAQARIQGAVNEKLNGAKLSMGAMGLSMAAMMVSSNKTVDTLAKWTMIGAIVAPIAIGLGNMVAETTILGVQMARLNVATAAEAGLLGTAAAAAQGFGMALNEALGPIGWIALGLTAVVGTFLAVKHHQDEIQRKQEAIVAEQIKANDTLNNSSASIATNLGKAAGYYKQISTGAGSSGDTPGQGNLLSRYNYYRGDGKAEVQGFVDQGTGALEQADVLQDKVRQKFVDLQVIGKDSAAQAKTDLQAMLLAAGMSAMQAADMADKVYKKYGDISKLDWTKPMKDQAKALADIAANNPLINTTPGRSVAGRGGTYSVIPDSYTINASTEKLIQQQATKAGQIFNQAMFSAKTSQDQKKVIDQFMQTALQEWNKGFANLSSQSGGGFTAIQDVFAKFGVTSGKSFAAAWETNADFKKAITDLGKNPANRSAMNEFMKATFAGTTFEKAVIQPMSKDSITLADGIWNVVGALKGFTAAGQGISSKKAYQNILGGTAYTQLASTQRTIQSLRSKGMQNSSAYLQQMVKLNSENKAVTKSANDLNRAYGFAQGKNAAEAMYNLLHRVKAGTDDAKNSADKLNHSLDSMPTMKTVNIQLKQIGGMVQGAMSDVQSDMATSAENKLSDAWDAREASAQARQEAASNALQNRQQAAQDAMDRRFQHREDEINKAYQKRINNVQREIKAEQDADASRQAMFEKEKARLQQLADLANNRIDFNTAVQEGNLDEAAKIQNNMGASQASNEMDAEESAAAARVQRRIDSLNKKNDRLEKQRDKELKKLQNMEDQQKKHLERMQAAQTAALEKRSAADMAAMKKQRDYDEAMLEQRLTLFKAYTARNQKDLESWMKTVGLSYDDFGSDVKAKGESWSKFFQTSLQAHIRAAGAQILSDNMWEKIGASMAVKLLKGIGFNSKAAFVNFVKTGHMPKDFSMGHSETRHSGGEVGGPGSRRTGYPSTYKGMARGERMVLAKDGEYIVNAKATKANRHLLERINRTSNISERGGLAPEPSSIDTYVKPAYGSVAGPMAGMVAQMYDQGLTKGMGMGMNKYAKAQAKNFKNRHGGNVPIYDGPIGDINSIGKSAIGWAADQIGSSGWFYQCLKFVRTALGAPPGADNAAHGWDQARYKEGISNPRKVPAGVPVWWHGGSGGDGHVALSTGGGNVISTDFPNIGTVGTGTIAGITSSWGEQLMGWSEDINGKRVWNPAWLRNGGTVRWDNTPAILHQGETVLTKKLTEQFKKNVASGGGNTYDVTLDLRGAYIKDDVDIKSAMDSWWKNKEVRTGKKRVLN